MVVIVEAISPKVLVNPSKKAPSFLSFLSFLLVNIIEFGRTFGFLKKLIFDTLPFGYLINELLDSLLILPPDFFM